MHVLLVNNSPIPVYGYGGTERVIWDLGKTLVRLGHRVSYLVPEGSTCDFGQVLPIQPEAPWAGQIPADVDITHFQFNPRCELDTPYLVTEHGNARKPKPLPLNTVFCRATMRRATAPRVLSTTGWTGLPMAWWTLSRHVGTTIFWERRHGASRTSKARSAWPAWHASSWTCWAARA